MLKRRQPAGALALAGFLFLLSGQYEHARAQDPVLIQDGATALPKNPFPNMPHSHFHALLEKTFLKIDVLTLDIQVGPGISTRIGELTAGQSYSDELADKVARVVLTAPEAFVRMEFLRDVKQSQFLDAIEKNLGRARDAGLITGEHRDEVVAKLPQWYAFLAERGVLKGDLVVYQIRGNTMRTVYWGVEGAAHLNLTREGERHKYGVLGAYFAPDSDFRKPLIQSILR